jgi:hypothetical protein
LASASAYFRLAAKAERARNYQAAGRYRDLAERLVNQDRRQREWMASRKEKRS